MRKVRRFCGQHQHQGPVRPPRQAKGGNCSVVSGTNSRRLTSALMEMSPQHGPYHDREDPEKIDELVVVSIKEFEEDE